MVHPSICQNFHHVLQATLLVLTVSVGTESAAFRELHSPLESLMPMTLSASASQTCSNSELITFTLLGLDQPVANVTNVTWVVTSASGNNDSAWELDPSGPGPTLGDWSNELTLAFTPLTPDTYTVSATVIYGDGSSESTFSGATLDVAGLPSVDGLEIFMTGDNGTPINALCDCSGEVTIQAMNPLVGGLPNGGINFSWSATWSDGTAAPLVGTGNGVTLTPCLNLAQEDYCGGFATPALNVSVELTSPDGCVSSEEWLDALYVAPPPSMTTTSSTFVCSGSPWDVVIEGPQSICFGPVDTPICFTSETCQIDAEIPFDCITVVGGNQALLNDETGPIVGSGSWTPASGGTTVTCSTTQTFLTRVLNVSTPIVTVSETSGVANDGVVCEGANVTIQASGFTGTNNSFDWFVNGNSIGTGFSTTWNNAETFGACSEEATLDLVLEFGQNYNPSLTSETCPVTVQTTFSVLPKPVASGIINTPAFCDSDLLVATLEASCGVPSWDGVEMTWDWSIPSDGGVLTGDQINLAVPVSFNGADCSESESQSLIATVSDGYGCTSDPTTLSFVVLERPDLTFVGNAVCSEDELEIEVCGADMYQWDVTFGTDIFLLNSEPAPSSCCPGNVRESIVHTNPLACNTVGIDVTGTLIHTVDGGDLMCSSTANYDCVVYDNPEIEPNLSINGPLCEGNLITFEDTNNSAGNVVYDFTSSQGLEVLDSSSPAVSFDATVGNTCLIVSKTQTYNFQGTSLSCATQWSECLDVAPIPAISVTHPASTCQGSPVDVIVEVTNPEPSCVYDFQMNGLSGGMAFISNGGTSSDTFVEYNLENVGGIEPTSSDPMTAIIRAICGGCESGSYLLNVDVWPTPVVAQTDFLLPQMCSPEGDCIELQVDNENLPQETLVEYFFETDPASLSPQFCDNFVNASPCPLNREVDWTVRFTHTTLDGAILFCTTSGVDETSVSPTPDPDFVFASPQDCFDPQNGNEVIIVHSSADYNVCPDDSLSFQWYASAGTGLDQNDVHLTESTAVVPELWCDSFGVIEVILEATNSYGCSQTTSEHLFTIQELPEPQLTFVQNSICLPTSVSIVNSSSGASDFVLEIPGYPTMENFASPLALDVEFPGYYNAEFSACKDHTIDNSTITCCSEVEYTEAFEGCTPPVAAFEVDSLVEFVNPVVHFENTSIGQIENIWSFGDGEGSSEVNPDWEYASSGQYNAQLLVVNECGCTDVASQVIEVANDVYLYVPNAFTPNNDGLNDAWFPEISGQELLAKYECWVFNRSGHLVFHTTNPNKAWTGENDITGAGDHFTGTSDVYSWRIALKKKDGRGADIYTGHVTMVR
ncbi:MAG: gliding motility-associated C-terminal domain-containing protein [Bacteroidetes bacterium]|nr:gliding motility-associated C-terminal domain-containing protein [Bacteroidota bacterium]MDA0903542.1 gliding motility-associated C-terminal domain-containing protein [Bacteroidota bacterium]MDA1241873.1 gliding motility-associated C-terminal domain-containing protein [Bacteroidota bacterium]